jgi:hypothetical protein
MSLPVLHSCGNSRSQPLSPHLLAFRPPFFVLNSFILRCLPHVVTSRRSRHYECCVHYTSTENGFEGSGRGLIHVIRVKLSLYLTRQVLHHEDVWRSQCIHPREWSVSRPGRFSRGEGAPESVLELRPLGRPVAIPTALPRKN